MIGLRDSLTLARTKFYARPVLLVLTLAVCGVLFGALYAGVNMASGAIASARAFALAASNGKYLVKVNPFIPPEVLTIVGSSNAPSAALQARLKALQADFIAEHKALAKQLGTTFDEKSVPEPLVNNPYANPTLPADQRVTINPNAPAAYAYVSELQVDYAKTAKNGYDQLQALAKSYGATGFYENTTASVGFDTMQFLPGGKEDVVNLSNSRSPAGDAYFGAAFLSSVQNSEYTFVSSDLVGGYVLPENDRRRANDHGVPVIITAAEAVKIFGTQYNIPSEPIAPKARIAWLKDMQDKLNGITYTSCYRNHADLNQLQQIKQTAQEMADHKNDANYVKPQVIYGLPTTACGDRVVVEDHRTAAVRAAEQHEADLQVKLGAVEMPQRQLVTFTVVGVMPVQRQDEMYKSIPAFLAGILSANYDEGAIIPRQLYDKLPAANRYGDILTRSYDSTKGAQAMRAAGLGEHIVAFSTAQQARKFIGEQTCDFADFNCKKLFTGTAYATNYLLFDDIQVLVTKVLGIALPIALGIAGLVVGFMMARIMIDNRRETAVFRAIGAKRRDIVSIYLMYTGMIALGIVLAGLGLGWLVAGGLQAWFGGDITAYARVAYGVYGSHQVFSLIGGQVMLQCQIAAGIVAICLVAVSLPLVRNVRRNPIDDMRDE
ncbi:MAG TPA: ABC transporter permease [Candidatus Saccharimonadia bacterium]